MRFRCVQLKDQNYNAQSESFDAKKNKENNKENNHNLLSLSIESDDKIDRNEDAYEDLLVNDDYDVVDDGYCSLDKLPYIPVWHLEYVFVLGYFY